MRLRPQNERLLFGLKLRQLRQDRNLSFQQLAAITGMSVSYLNEIERGKKSPRSEKLEELARALDVGMDDLNDVTLVASMMPVVKLLQSDFLNELPLDRFGIELAKIIEIIASAPARVGAFISALLELSRNYALLDENFYLAALRSWLEMHENYLEDSEAFAKTLRIELGWHPEYVPTLKDLSDLLEDRFDYRLVRGGIDEHQSFTGLLRVYVPTDRSLLLASTLDERELRYHYASEVGYQIQELSARSLTAPMMQVRGFDMALAHARANAFAAALLLPAEQVDAEIKDFFGVGEPALDVFEQLLAKYRVSPELLLDRLTAMLPRFRDMKSLFFIKLVETLPGQMHVTRELHLGERHRPHATGLLEHYCRRWVGAQLLMRGRDRIQTGVQIEQFYGSADQYLVLALADTEHNGQRQASFIGVPLTSDLEATIPSLLRSELKHRIVNNTCERCPIADCDERAAPPTVAEAKKQRRAVQDTIEELQRKARQAARRSSKRI